MGAVKPEDECAALTELRQRRLKGGVGRKLLPAILYRLKIQRLVETDDNGELQINARGLARLRRLLRSGVGFTRRKNWRLGR